MVIRGRSGSGRSASGGANRTQAEQANFFSAGNRAVSQLLIQRRVSRREVGTARTGLANSDLREWINPSSLEDLAHHVQIHSDVDSFGSALVDFHDRSAAASGQSRTDQSRQRDRDRALLGQVSGFTDREHRVVHLAPSAETRTAVHELLHDLSDPAIEALGTPIDEGITEALTRRVLRPAGIPNPGSAYEAFADIAELLIDAVGLELVGSAYFRGEVPALRGAVGQGSGDRWTDLTRAWVSGDRDGATRALAGVRHAPG